MRVSPCRNASRCVARRGNTAHNATRRRATRRNATQRNAARLVARGSWLVARGSWLVARGSWLVARGSWFVVRPGICPSVFVSPFISLMNGQTFVGLQDGHIPGRTTNHEPRATSHEPRATSHEPRATSHEPRATSHEPRRVALRRVASRRSTSCCVVRCVAAPRNATRCVATRRNSHFKRNGAAIFKSEM